MIFGIYDVMCLKATKNKQRMSCKRTRTIDPVRVGDVLRFGETITCNTLINECNLFWVKERTGIEGYYKDTCGGELKKMTAAMCSQLWNLEKEHLQVRSNEQVLPNGVQIIPVVSPQHLGRHPSKDQCTTKIAKQAVGTLNNTLRMYNFNIGASSCVPASRIVIPPGTLTSAKKHKKINNDDLKKSNPETVRVQLTHYLETLRTAACVSHLAKLEDNVISRVGSVNELANLSVECAEGETHINIAKYLICMYHILFPVE